MRKDSVKFKSVAFTPENILRYSRPLVWLELLRVYIGAAIVGCSCWQVQDLNALTELLFVVWTDLHINTVQHQSLGITCKMHMTHYHMTHSSLASRLPHPFNCSRHVTSEIRNFAYLLVFSSRRHPEPMRHPSTIWA
jgi:hypothetical protein